MLRTIRAKLFAILLILGVFILGSFSLSYYFVREHQFDEELVNLVSTDIQILNELSQSAIQMHEPADQGLIQRFESSLTVLADGGEIISEDGQVRQITGIPEASPIVSEIRLHWDHYLLTLVAVSETSPDLEEHDQLESELLGHANEINRLLFSTWEILEEGSDVKHSRLILFDLVILALTFPVVGFSLILVNQRIADPLAKLTKTALNFRASGERIIQPSQKDEIGYLEEAFEKMRVEIIAYDDALERRIENRVREISTAYAISQDIVRQLELNDLLDAARDKVQMLLRADAVSICLLDVNTNTITQVVSTSELPLTNRQISAQHADNRFAGRRERETVVHQVRPGECELLKQINGNRCFATPLVLGDETLGEICVVRPEASPLNENEKRVLMLLANAIAVAVQNARLSVQIRQQASEQARLYERERVASELHDHLAQTLSLLNLQADRLTQALPGGLNLEIPQYMKEIRENLTLALEQVRIAITGYKEPSAQDTGKFALQLHEFVSEFGKEHDIEVSFQGDEKIYSRFEPIVQKQILYILREALTNTSKHASAARAEITFSEEGYLGVITISDDGAGFDVNAPVGDHHLGMQIMKARAERTGGKVDVTSARGQGTTIKISFPFKSTQTVKMDQS